MLNHQADLGLVVRSQLTTLETLNRLAHMRAWIRARIDVIARVEDDIRKVQQLLASAGLPAGAGETLRKHESA
jgi:hypothetical protein